MLDKKREQMKVRVIAVSLNPWQCNSNHLGPHSHHHFDCKVKLRGVLLYKERFNQNVMVVITLYNHLSDLIVIITDCQVKRYHVERRERVCQRD